MSFRLGEADDFPFSEELQKAVFSVLPSKDPLDDPSFNAVDFINGLFPDGALCEHLVSRCKEKPAILVFPWCFSSQVLTVDFWSCLIDFGCY
jgi:hypothetical protein